MSHILKSFLLATFLLIKGLEAKNLGVYGMTSSIDEEDLIHFLQAKIMSFSEEQREDFLKKIQSTIFSQINKTLEIKGFKKAKAYSITYYDPSIYVDQDITNHNGQIIVKKGTKFNPLSHVSLTQDLLFFDATDIDQLNWAKTQNSSRKWILIKGNLLELEEELNRPIYFDQGGTLTKKFGIKEVPTRISQEGLKLKIESFPVGEKHV